MHELHSFIAMVDALTLFIVCSGEVSEVWREKCIDFSKFVPLMPVVLIYREVL